MDRGFVLMVEEEEEEEEDFLFFSLETVLWEVAGREVDSIVRCFLRGDEEEDDEEEEEEEEALVSL